MSAKHAAVQKIRGIARATAVVVFLFWCAFFVEHVNQWFIAPWPQMPPAYVWLQMLFHLLILAGLLIGFLWEYAGGMLIYCASVLFLIDKQPLLILPTIVPGMLYLYCWYIEPSFTNHTLKWVRR